MYYHIAFTTTVYWNLSQLSMNVRLLKCYLIFPCFVWYISDVELICPCCVWYISDVELICPCFVWYISDVELICPCFVWYISDSKLVADEMYKCTSASSWQQVKHVERNRHTTHRPRYTFLYYHFCFLPNIQSSLYHSDANNHLCYFLWHHQKQSINISIRTNIMLSSNFSRSPVNKDHFQTGLFYIF
jgi:hypothetical protein